MRRRALPLLLTAAAAVVALVRRSRRRTPPAPPRYVSQPATSALTPAEARDDVVIADRSGGPDPTPHPQVEGETKTNATPEPKEAVHNAEAATPGSPFRSVAWELLDGEPEPDATELRIGFSLVGRYETLARIDVRETASQVFVTVLARFDPPEGGWFGYAEAHQATIVLDGPLGDRALVHAPTDEPSG